MSHKAVRPVARALRPCRTHAQRAVAPYQPPLPCLPCPPNSPRLICCNALTMSSNPSNWPAILDPFVFKHEGKYLYLNEEIFKSLQTLAHLEPFYFQAGGAGD